MPPDDPGNPYAPPKAPIGTHVYDPDPGIPVDGAEIQWKTVVAFGTPARALEALKLLESARIGCRILDDGVESGAVTVHWARSNPLGGHLVQVHPDDLGHAARVLGVALEPEEAATPVNLHDERMKKAMAFAFFGTLICPVIAHLGSLAMILGTPGHLLTQVGRRRRRIALIANLVVLGVLGFLAFTEPTTAPLERVRKPLHRSADPDGVQR